MHEISRAVDGVDDPRGRIRELYLRTARDGLFADESENSCIYIIIFLEFRRITYENKIKNKAKTLIFRSAHRILHRNSWIIWWLIFENLVMKVILILQAVFISFSWNLQKDWLVIGKSLAEPVDEHFLDSLVCLGHQIRGRGFCHHHTCWRVECIPYQLKIS